MRSQKRKEKLRKPFQAVPIELGKAYRQRNTRRRRIGILKRSLLLGGLAVGVFGAGIVITNIGHLSAANEQSAAGPSRDGDCHMLSVHDGDTIRCGSEKIRIENIDAPELDGSPKCEDGRAARAWCDDALGQKSRDKLKVFLGQGTIQISRHGRDKYGRTLALVSVDGRDAGEFLIAEGLAKRLE